MNYPVRSFRQFVTEGGPTSVDSAATHQALAGGPGSQGEGSAGPGNQFAYFNNRDVGYAEDGYYGDARNLASARERRLAMQNRYGRSTADAALRNAASRVGPSLPSGHAAWWSPLSHASGNWGEWNLNDPDRRAAYTNTRQRQRQTYRDQNPGTPGSALGKGSDTTSDNRKRVR
mgnify:CR=1 FL=1